MKILGNVIKSQSDQRLYRAIRLRNQIDCLIISDLEAKKSSAAMSVAVGSLQDPLEAQGLAHYLEHMLFMGTKKYPNENDYSNFIAKNVGMSNAYTSQQETNYHFEVSSPAFEETLDRFAQFFICPIMSDSSSERELNAVHSEHSKNRQNDMWRKFQLEKHLSKEGHPYKKFSTGDRNSLSHPNLREMLHNFYNSNYSSNLMKLVVYGNKQPEEMAQLVEHTFSDVPNKNYKRFQMLDIPYGPEAFGKIYQITPIQDKKMLELSWILSDQRLHYENSPAAYLSHLVGHEGRGSLLSFLIGEGLAVGLSCGANDAFNLFSQFSVKINLTSEGVQKASEVIEHVFRYIEMLQKSQPEEWVFREIQATNKMMFDYQEKTKGMAFASGLAKRLHDHKIEEVLAYPYFMKEWRPQLIQDYTSQLTRANVMAFIEAKEVEHLCDLEEPIYKTKYGIRDIQSVQTKPTRIHLPEPNTFIPQDFTVLPLGTLKQPERVSLDEEREKRVELYFKKDHQFALPKVALKMRLYFGGQNSARESIGRQIYMEMLNEDLREFEYLGETAGIGSSFSYASHFMADIQISGFRDSVQRFSSPFVQRIFEFEPSDRKFFHTVKDKLKRAYSNYFLGNPYGLAYNHLSMCLRHGIDASPAQKLAIIDQVDFEEVLAFGRQWKERLYMEAYASGNIQERDAVKLVSQVEGLLEKYSKPLPTKNIDQVRGVQLPPQKTWVIKDTLKSKEEENSAVIVHYQHQASTTRSKVLQELAIYFVKEPAFDYLRTKQQLGYIVMCMPEDNRGVLGLSILVQSAIKTSHEIISYVDIFLKEILPEKLSQLDEAGFDSFKQSLRSSKEEKDKNLLSEAGRFWSEIAKHTYLFNRQEAELKELETITLAEFKSFINLIFYIDQKRIEVHMASHKQQSKNDQLEKERLAADPTMRVVSDCDAFKKKMALFPDFYGHL